MCETKNDIPQNVPICILPSEIFPGERYKRNGSEQPRLLSTSASNPFSFDLRAGDGVRGRGG